MSYILPQVLVFQEFRQLPVNVTKYLNPFAFGPHYRLFRYKVEAEKRYIGLGAYDNDSSVEYAYPALPANSTPDTTYVKLFMDNAWGRYCFITEDAPVNAASSRSNCSVTPPSPSQPLANTSAIILSSAFPTDGLLMGMGML